MTLRPSALRPNRAGLLLLLWLAGTAPAAAQAPGFTPGDWSRVRTEHFEFLFPDELSDWALHMAARMESVHREVEALVGFAPEDRVTVLVDDPGNVSNGSMNPGPLLYMWPTPPHPRSVIGENRGWGEILAVHEFAHAAHLTRPSRAPIRRFFVSLLPVPVTAMMWKTPRWVTEGYATYVEGRLTGSGRPHGVWRPAVLRTWALEGQLPTYGAVSGSSGYWGGAMAYLVGSAYLEWLVEREGAGEEVLPRVWRRLTARQQRTFGEAFAGVFGAPPDELYGRFTVDVTERALAVESAVEAAGSVVDGELFQRLAWSTGDPAVSPDGERLALVLRSRDAPSRLVVISTTPDTLTTRQRERREAIFEADPEDVRPVESRPRSQKPLATLHPYLGRAYDAPAWMPDGRSLLVVRSDLAGNGRSRPDLFLWSWESGALRRITHGAAVREAAPAPDGTWAVGTRCLHGRCGLVRIDLDDGAVRTLAEADLLGPYYHPRVSPDGGTIVASLQTGGGWRLVAMDADGSDRRVLGPRDGADRFDAEFLPDGRLVLTSTRGGIHDLEILDPGTGEARALTRMLDAAVAPSVGAEGDVFFLSLHSRGWDLRRIGRDGVALPEVMADEALAPAAAVSREAGATFEEADIGPVRGYGVGPRFHSYLPLVHLAEEGFGGGVAIAGTDPIGRLSWQIQGMYGDEEAPAGGALRVGYRGVGPWVRLEGFWTRDPFAIRPGGSPGRDRVPVDAALVPIALGDDDAFYGGFGALEVRRDGLRLAQGLRGGGSIARLDGADAGRIAGFAEYDGRLRQGLGRWRFEQGLAAHGAAGRTGSLDWTRWIVSGELRIHGQERGLGVTGTMGGTDAPAGSVELFSVGGTAPLLFDPAVLSQRVAMPALTADALVGPRVRTVKAELSGGFLLDSFFWAGDVEGDGRGWRHVAGIDLDQATPPVPYLRIPAMRVTAGLGRLLNGPEEGDWRAWLTMGFLP